MLSNAPTHEPVDTLGYDVPDENPSNLTTWTRKAKKTALDAVPLHIVQGFYPIQTIGLPLNFNRSTKY